MYAVMTDMTGTITAITVIIGAVATAVISIFKNRSDNRVAEEKAVAEAKIALLKQEAENKVAIATHSLLEGLKLNIETAQREIKDLHQLYLISQIENAQTKAKLTATLGIEIPNEKTS